MKFKIYISDIIALLFFHISFITLPYFEQYNLMKYGIIVIIALYLFGNFKVIFEEKYRMTNIMLYLFLLVVLITGYLNKNNLENRNVFLAAIVFVTIVLEAFFLFQCFEHKNKIRRVIGITYRLMVLYVVLTDILLLLNPRLVERTEGYYLIGNKFSVVYAHLLMICLYWYTKSEKKKMSKDNQMVFLLMYVLTIYISLYIDCATGVVGSVLLCLFMILHYQIVLLIMKPLVPVIVVCVSCVCLFVFDSMLDNSIVKFIVEELLQRDITLTGRMDIYSNVLSLLPGHFISGYGHGSTFEVCMELLGAPNTQNGLLELLIQYGIVGVILFLLLMFFVFRKNSNLNKRPHSIAIVIMIYIYIILASVEITLNLEFFVLLAILTACSEMDKQYNLNIELEGEKR